MLRPIAILAATIVLTSSVASAASFRFLPGTVPDGENALTVIGDGRFEVSDESNPAPNSHQFSVVTPFDVEVTAGDGAGGTFPVVFTLDRVSTTNDKVNLVFMNPTYNDLLLFFDAPGVVKGDMIPSTPITDADGAVRWNAPSLIPESPGIALAGTLSNAAIVPEPVIGCAATALLFAFVALRQRRR